MVSVGKILYDLHADLQGLKTQLDEGRGVAGLREQLERAERNLKDKAAEVLAFQTHLDQAESLQNLKPSAGPMTRGRAGGPRGRKPHHLAGVPAPLPTTPRETLMSSNKPGARLGPVGGLHPTPVKTASLIGANEHPGLSNGVKHNLAGNYVFGGSSSSTATRKKFHSAFAHHDQLIPIVITETQPHPNIGHRAVGGGAPGSLYQGKTSASKRILPRINRKNAQAPPPELTVEDLECGLYSLTSRGFLPPSADLTPGLLEYKPIMTQKPVEIHDLKSKAEPHVAATNTAQASMLVKLDLRPVTADSSELQAHRKAMNARDRARSANARGHGGGWRGNQPASRPHARAYINEDGECNALVPLDEFLPPLQKDSGRPPPLTMEERNLLMGGRSPDPAVQKPEGGRALFKDTEIKQLGMAIDNTFITTENEGHVNTNEMRAEILGGGENTDAVKKEILASETETRLIKEVYNIDRRSHDMLSKEVYTVDKVKNKLMKREVFSVDKRSSRVCKDIFYYISFSYLRDHNAAMEQESKEAAERAEKLLDQTKEADKDIMAVSSRNIVGALAIEESIKPEPSLGASAGTVAVATIAPTDMARGDGDDDDDKEPSFTSNRRDATMLEEILPPALLETFDSDYAHFLGSERTGQRPLIVLKESYVIERTTNEVIEKELITIDPKNKKILSHIKYDKENNRAEEHFLKTSNNNIDMDDNTFRLKIMGNFDSETAGEGAFNLDKIQSSSVTDLQKARELEIKKREWEEAMARKALEQKNPNQIGYFGGTTIYSAAAAETVKANDGQVSMSMALGDKRDILPGYRNNNPNNPINIHRSLQAIREPVLKKVFAPATQENYEKNMAKNMEDAEAHAKWVLAKYGVKKVEREGEGDIVIRFGNIFNDLSYLKEQQRSNWSQIVEMMVILCRKLKKVPVAVVDVSKLVDLVFNSPHKAGAGRHTQPFAMPRMVDILLSIRNLDEMKWLEKEVPGLRFRGERRREIAAECILGGWVMYQCKLKCALLRKYHQAARVIQVQWISCQNLVETKKAVNMIRQEEAKAFQRLRQDFTARMKRKMVLQTGSETSDAVAQLSTRVLEIHLLTLSIPEQRRAQMHAFQGRQNEQLSRIFRLGFCGPQNTEAPPDVILVCSKEVHEDLLEYITKVMEYRGIPNPAARLQIVVPENSARAYPILPQHINLAHSLLLSPKALNRLKVLTKGREDRTVIIPGHGITFSELQLSAQLGVPLFGADPKNVDFLTTKSAMYRLVTLSQLPSPPTSVDLYDPEEFYTQFGLLVYENPAVPKWIFKIDDEFQSKGSVIFHIDQSIRRHIGEIQKKIIHNYFQETGNPELLHTEKVANLNRVHISCFKIGEPNVSANELRDMLVRAIREVLGRVFSKKALICGSAGMYPNEILDFLPEFCRRGGVIQAVPEEVVCFPSVHFRVQADEKTQLLGTSEFIFSNSFEPVAALLPQQHGHHVSPEIAEAFATKMGTVLLGKDILGYGSIDMVCFDNPDYKPDDRAMMSGSAGSTFDALKSPEPPDSPGDNAMTKRLLEQYGTDEYKQNIVDPVTTAKAQNRHHPSAFWVVDVDLKMTDPSAALAAFQFIGQVALDPKDGKFYLGDHAPCYNKDDKAANERVALVTMVCEVPGLAKCNYSQVFSYCKHKKVTYDLFQNTGVVFLQLDLVHEFVALLVVDRNLKLLLEKASNSLQVLYNISLQSSVIQEARRGEDCVPHIRDTMAAIRGCRKKWMLL